MFEWDEAKNQKTFADRGISFDFAVQVWLDENGLDIPAKVEGEPRWARIGSIQSKIYVVIYTIRGDKIRVISARRAHINEEKNYRKKSEEIKRTYED